VNNGMAERKVLLDEMRRQLEAVSLPEQDIREILTRCALTDIAVLHDIVKNGVKLAAGRTGARTKRGKGE